MIALVFPSTMENAVTAHLSQRDRMDADHQAVIALIFLHHLQGTRLVGVTTIKRIAQKQHDGFVASKLSCLINGMAEASLLFLIDIVQAFTNVEDMVLIFLGLRVEFAQMFFR